MYDMEFHGDHMIVISLNKYDLLKDQKRINKILYSFHLFPGLILLYLEN